ncbi:MAG TPA: IS1380 family transposase [Candidatus Micrarchaeia archaeon]|nr:IS1380 family transposase [Candidatus Micrarchaeia archaeon]
MPPFSHSLDRIGVAFDDPHAVAHAGLLLPATLAQKLSLPALLDRHVDLGTAPGHAHVGLEAMTVVAAMLAGADSIDDTAVLRAAATGAVLGHRLRAPSTLGTFRRSFTYGHVRQVDAVSRAALARARAAGAGPGGGPLTIELDSTICETYGPAKQGAGFGYTKVRGYHPLLATRAGAGDILHTRLRGGRAHSGRGGASFLRETFARVRAAGATGPITLRADSGFYAQAVVRTCRRADVRFSITVRLHPALRTAIASIPAEAWTPIPYGSSAGTFGFDADGHPISGADVAETTSAPFGTRGTPVRLIVRRVRPTQDSQLALFTEFAYHAFITDRAGDMLSLEADHRAHAEVETAIRDLKEGAGLAHLHSGRFAANAAWLTFAGLAHNCGRWVGMIGLPDAVPARTTAATLRRRLFALPGRLTRSARRWTLHLPRDWPWQALFGAALTRLRAIRASC